MTTTAVSPRAVNSLHAGRSASRKFKNSLATTLVWASFLVALVPLVWLLWTVLSKGLYAITRGDWWTQTQRGMTFKDPGGGAL
ncbi:MAG TPA: hypothetical protein VK816_01615, partial [Jatrophihabitantaceae bacterium]|nr:hypothetical protein [Jatrophihabitantaceae bacterium]